MRRPKVHKVTPVTLTDGPFYFMSRQPTYVTILTGYRTRCGITGGAELLKLTGINNGSGAFCAGCHPGATIRRNAGYRAREEQRWR